MQSSSGSDPASVKDKEISWRTLPHSVTAHHRAVLTQRLDEFIAEWITPYNIGARCIYWLAYVLSIAPSLLIAGRLHFTCAGAWPCCAILPMFTATTIIALLAALTVMTAIYEYLPSEINFLSLRGDVAITALLAMVLIALGLITHHAYECANIPTWAAGIAGFIGCIWLVFLLINPIIYPFLLEHWLNRLLIAHPVAAIVYAIKEVVRVSREAAETGIPEDLNARAETVLDLEIAATAMRRGITAAFKLRGSPTYTWLTSESTDMAAAIRDFQQPMIFPDLTEFTKVETSAAKALKAAVEEDWSNFPRIQKPQPEESAAPDWSDRLRLLTIALLPGAGVLVAVWLQRHYGASYLSPSVLFWSAILSLSWCVFNLLRTLTPDLDTRISAFTTAIGALSPLAKQGKKE